MVCRGGAGRDADAARMHRNEKFGYDVPVEGSAKTIEDF
jgi:hypothetical protein